MKALKNLLTSFLFLSFFLSPFSGLIQPVIADTNGCSISGPSSGSYTVELCFSSPIDGDYISGDTLVSSSYTFTGSSPGIQRVIYYLNNEYLLTDFESEYSFLLPTTKFVDGVYTLSADVIMRDGYAFQMGSVTINFNNGITTPPTNTNSFQPFTSPAYQNGQPYLVAAGGDGASGESSALDVTNLMKDLNPDMFLYLGDVYNKGTYTEFYNWYGNNQTYFGQFKSITNPIVGNHEYENGVAPGYFDYWDNVPDYYSYDAGGWHFIGLNSNSSIVDVSPTSAQYQWLQADLIANSDKCTVVYYHHPLFNIGPPSATTEMMDIWNLLVQNGVEIVLNGHDHTYQRWSPIGLDGVLDQNGITEFVAGASGHGVQTISKSDSRVAFSSDANPGALGVLLLELNTLGANFKYVNTAGDIIDSGAIPCSTTTLDIQPPSTPENLTATIINSTQVDVSWNPSTDNSAVAGYTIYRNNVAIANVSYGNSSFLDSNLTPNTTYNYFVEAFDLSGNYSNPSNQSAITTPPIPGTLTFSVDADTYVNASNPVANYGLATSLRMDSSPDVHSYLKFNVTGLAGNPIIGARLQVFSNSSSSLGLNAKEVLDTSWGEYSISYDNAPALLGVISSSGAISSGTWVELDVSSYISSEGIYSIGLDTDSTTALSLASRESGLNSPRLLIDLQTNGVDTESPTTPSGLSSSIGMNPLTVGLTWSPSTDNVGVVGYDILRNDQLIGSVAGDVLSFVDSNVSPLTNYSYSINAFDQAGNHSTNSDIVTVDTPENQPPTIPTDFLATMNGDNSVTLSWSPSTDNVGVAGYTIYRDGTELITLFGNVLTYLDNSVSIGSSYEYTIDAFDQAGNRSGLSSPALITISDNDPPSTPTGLIASFVDINQVDLSWDPSIDNVAVTGYTIYRDGVAINSVSGLETTFIDTTISPNTEYSYTIDAFDLAGNHSAESGPILVNVPDLPQVLNILPDSDAYVDASFPTNNYGSSIILRVDASPDLHSYLKFTIPELGSKSISQAHLYLYANSAVAYDLNAFEVSDNTWNENTITYDNSPSLGNLISSAGQASSGTWEIIDVTSYLTGSGVISIGLTTTSSTSTSLASRESGLNSPYLVLDLYTPIVDNTSPSAPGNLMLLSVDPNSVELGWSASTDNVAVTGYEIYRDNQLLETVSDTTLNYIDQTVSPLTDYSYSILAFDGAGNYSDASVINVSTPDIPAVITILSQEDSYVNIDFPDTNYGSSTSLRVDGSPDTLSYLKFDASNLNGKIISNAQLFIYATSRSNKGLNVYSVPENNWTENAITYNNKPILGTFVASNSSNVSGIWLSFDVSNVISSEGVYTLAVKTPSSTSISFASRESGSFSAYLQLNLATFTIDTDPPSIPTNLSASIFSTNQVNLSWSASTDNVGVVGYTINRDGVPVTSVSGTTLSYIDTGLTPLTTYNYSVDAFDAEGNYSGLSAPVSITMPENEPPTTPQIISAEDFGPTHVTISWTASTDNVGIEGYTLYRNGTILSVVDAQTLTWDDFTVEPGLTYSYSLDAFDAAGNHSALSTPIDVTVSIQDTEPPSTPTGLSASATSPTQILLNWSASTDNVGVAGYTLYRDGAFLTTVASSTLSYEDIDLQSNTSYSYTIDAFDQSGNYSLMSDTVQTTTLQLPATVTLIANEDAYVNIDFPDTNYGSSTSLRVDGSPDVQSFIKFDASNLYGKTITNAQLFIYVTSKSNKGLNVYSVPDNNWAENSITYNNKPSLGTLIGSNSTGVSGIWLSFDVTNAISVEGIYTIAVNTPGSTAISIASRETIDFAPKLVIDLQ